MELEITDHIQASTKEKLDSIKRISAAGNEYWMARDLGPLLGYPKWGTFEPVVNRAETSITRTGSDLSLHIVKTRKPLKAKNGAVMPGRDYYLSKGACHVIAMNGEPSKPEIAAAQAYFAIQTHRMEEQDTQTEELSEDAKCLRLRGKVSVSFKRVSNVADQAGVRRQAVFHDQRYKGLYGMGRAAVYDKKGLGPAEELLDRIGVLELSAHEFQMNLAANAIERENVQGEPAALQKNLEVAQEVRRAWDNSGATLPEDLPKAEHISYVRRRLTGRKTKSSVIQNEPTVSGQLSLLSQPSVPE